MWKSEARKRQCQARGFWGHSPVSHLQQRPTFVPGHLRNTQYIHELLHLIPPLWSGSQPIAVYDRPIDHVLNAVSSTAWYNQAEKIRYNSLAIKHQQTKNVATGHHTKFSSTSYYDAAQLWQSRMKQLDGLWSLNSSPSNFGWLQLEPKPKTIRWLIRSLKSGFQLHSLTLWGERVNLLRDEHGLPYVHIIIFVWMGVWRGV